VPGERRSRAPWTRTQCRAWPRCLHAEAASARGGGKCVASVQHARYRRRRRRLLGECSCAAQSALTNAPKPWASALSAAIAAARATTTAPEFSRPFRRAARE
jgi:hypothetical protein